MAAGWKLPKATATALRKKLLSGKKGNKIKKIVIAERKQLGTEAKPQLGTTAKGK